MTTYQELNDSFASLTVQVLKVTRDRDMLLLACMNAEDWIRTFLAEHGPAENKLLETLQAAIEQAEGAS